MSDFQQRRRVLQLAGTGVAASIAGCSDLSVTDDTDAQSGSETELTAIAEPSSEELQELQEAFDSGELSPEEAQQRERELFEDAIEDFEDRVAAENDEDLVIEDAESEMGVYLVDGTADVLVDALRTGDISVLGTSGLYDQLLRQQQSPQGGDPEGQEIDEEELEEQLQEQIDEQEAETSTDDGNDDESTDD